MAQTTRQTAVFGVEDWKQIYQTYREADFQSYDFETLRKSFIDYLRLYYPETFNDYTESSEFIALLDIIAFMGQSLAFRNDLNTRENYIGTAERRNSVVQLANLVSYTAKRNAAAQGLLKAFNISTTENVIDYQGVNLSGVTINWNDPTNPDWQEQWNAIVNASLVNSQKIGRPGNRQTILGVRTDEYSINFVPGFLPVIPYSATVDGINMPFEAMSSSIAGQEYIYEPSPRPTGIFNLMYRNDQLGYASADNGFFFLFKQGVLQNQDFNLAERIANNTTDINIEGVNNEDRWLFQLDNVGTVSREWQYVENIYSAAAEQNQQLRPIYTVTSRTNDQITLVFGDGVFSEIPVGQFRCYVRASNGLQYIINPEEMQNVVLNINYISRNGNVETMTFTCGITKPVANSQTRESIAEIKQRAPARYYTQNRMVNGEDYNLFPFTAYNSILKSKAVNRASIGTSRYLDLVDNTGKYSSTNTFGSDGGMWEQNILPTILFSWTNRNEIADVIANQVQPQLIQPTMRQFYYANFPRENMSTLDLVCSDTTSTGNTITVAAAYQEQFFLYAQVGLKIFFTGGVASTGLIQDLPYFITSTDPVNGTFTVSVAPSGAPQTLTSQVGLTMTANLQVSTYGSTWHQSTTLGAATTGYFENSAGDPISVGLDTDTTFRYAVVGSLIKFVAPTGYYFDANNKLKLGLPNRPEDHTEIWASPMEIVGNGSNGGVGNLANGQGPITINNFVPTGAIVDSIIPIFVGDLPLAIEQAMSEQIILSRDFGLGYANTDITTPQGGTIPAGSWYLITSANLDADAAWSQDYAGDSSGTNQDASWLIQFVYANGQYTITFRGLAYYFGSVLQTRFFFYGAQKIYDSRTGTTIRDFVNVLAVNTRPDSNQPLPGDIPVTIIDQPVESDGYVDDFQVLISYRDSDSDGVPDNPDFFQEIVAPQVDPNNKLIFLESTVDVNNLQRYLLAEPGRVTTDYATLDEIELAKTEWIPGQVFYATTEQAFYELIRTATGELQVNATSNWVARVGRQALYYQYRHNAPLTARIDPGTSNIIDIYVVTKEYYNAYQNWLRDITGTVVEPAQPTISELTTAYQRLEDYKMLSDNIVFNPVTFKPLFGAKAQPTLRGTIKVTPAQGTTASAAEIKSSVLAQMNEYFSIDKWNFGDTFYFSELAAYLHRTLGTIISSVVLVPLDPQKAFGDLYEIRSQPNEIFANGANIDNIEIIDALTSTNLRTAPGSGVI